MTKLRRTDILDTEIVDAIELASDGTTTLQGGVSIVSVVGATKTVTITGWNLNEPDNPIEAEDIAVITGNAAAGTYTVASVVDNTHFVVTEAIVDAAGGAVEFRYPAGALKVGFDPVGLVVATSNDVQGALQDHDPSIADSVHRSVANEFAALAAKANPESADVLLIEDAASSYSKKRIQIGNLPVTAYWTGVRYYAIDYDNGSDSNLGYSDVSMAAAGAVAFKTIEQFLSVFPHAGNGCKAVVAIRSRAAGATYRNKANTANDVLDLSHVTDYAYLLVRGTNTVSTANTVAFSNDVNDKKCCGSKIVTGTNAAGYEPTGVPTSRTFTCQLTGGGAPGLTAEPALLGKRIRFDWDTDTSVLRNASAMIWMNTTDTITLAANLGATPTTSDVFYIEDPGVAVDGVICTSPTTPYGAQPVLPTPLQLTGLNIVGLRAVRTWAPAVFVSGYSVLVNLSFVDVPNVASTTYDLSFININNLGLLHTYYDETGNAITTGVGVRAGGGFTFFSIAALSFVRCAAATQRINLYYVTAPTVGGGCYAQKGIALWSCMSGIPTTASGVWIGNGGSVTVSRLRITAPGISTEGIRVDRGDAPIMGCDITGCGTSPVIRVLGVGQRLTIQDVVGSTGNTGNGLDLTAACDAHIMMGSTNPNTFTAAAGKDIAGCGPVYYVHADYTRTDLFDTRGNHIQNAGTNLGSQQFLTNDGNGNIAQYQVTRVTGNGLVRAAFADAAANASGVAGVSQSAFTTTGAKYAMHVVSGSTWVQFDANPTAGNIAYLSTTTAGNAQDTAPVVAGTNQKLRLGIILKTSGTLGLVALELESLPVLADGNP